MKTDPSGSLLLTPLQQAVVNIALEMDNDDSRRARIAAQYLRDRYLSGIDWDSAVVIAHVPWEELFRRHSAEAARQVELDTPH